MLLLLIYQQQWYWWYEMGIDIHVQRLMKSCILTIIDINCTTFCQPLWWLVIRWYSSVFNLSFVFNQTMTIVQCMPIMTASTEREVLYIACCLMAPSHYLNQCLLIIKGVLQQSHESNLWQVLINLMHVFGDYTFEITTTSARGQWVNATNKWGLSLGSPYWHHWTGTLLFLNGNCRCFSDWMSAKSGGCQTPSELQ